MRVGVACGADEIVGVEVGAAVGGVTPGGYVGVTVGVDDGTGVSVRVLVGRTWVAVDVAVAAFASGTGVMTEVS